MLPPMTEEGGPRFSLPVNEGAGAMLGVAAGDSAGGDFESGYAASTQQAVVVTYHLLRHGELNREQLAQDLLEMHGDDRDPSVYRATSPELRAWLDSMRAGKPEYCSDPSLDPSVRMTPVGMWFRRRPEALVDAALEAARVTHLDGPSAVMAAATAAAVAAGCFAQNGRDLLMAVTDVASRAAWRVQEESLRYAHLDQVEVTVDRVRRGFELVGTPIDRLVEETGRDPIGQGVAGLVLAAAVGRDPDRILEDAARIGGSPLGSIVGGVVGARVGIRHWPWPIPNDTWFMALGHRLVDGEADLADLPVPYAVEQRITYVSNDQRI